MEAVTFGLVSTKPMLQHNIQMANPANKYVLAKAAIDAKEKKTDAGQNELFWINFQGCLYHDDEMGPYIPGVQIESALYAAATAEKLGKLFKSSVVCVEDRIKLIYKGPRDMKGLFDAGFVDIRAVVINRAKIMCCRPRFDEWSATCTISYDETVVDRAALVRAMQRAGERCCIGDYRPKFGGFTATPKK